MHIYSYTDLYNRHVQEQANEALDHKCITAESHKTIVQAYSTSLYTPNNFIYIALVLLTVVAVLFASLLFSMMFGVSASGNLVVLLMLLSMINYAALELLVRDKHYYNAGIDNVLMLFSVAFFAGSLIVNTYADQSLAVSIVSMLLCFWMTLRFTDAFMAMLTYVALLATVFLAYIKLGSIAKATAPVIMMMSSAVVYYLVKKSMSTTKLLFYHYCLKCVMLLTLLSFYCACNYYAVKELSNEMFNLNLALKDSIPFGWLFWIFTFIVPPLYVVYGIKRKDLLFIRTGVVLTVVSILTFRYYNAVMPAEAAMLTGGCVVTIVCYWLTKYLRIPRNGFVFIKVRSKTKENIALETVLLIETADEKELVEPHTQFGGGDFGGGGAGGKF